MKKITALILTIAFLAITPAQAAAPARKAKAVPTHSPGGGQWCCADRSA